MGSSSCSEMLQYAPPNLKITQSAGCTLLPDRSWLLFVHLDNDQFDDV